jgi:hypothetical protein
MRPKATTRRFNWVQLGMGAGALLLPPLAIGAALYSMLAPPDEDFTRPAGAQAAVPPPAAVVPAAGKSTGDVTRPPGRGPVQGGAAPAAPVQVAPVAPIQITTTAATANSGGDAEGSATPPAAESPPAAPKRPHRRARTQQDPSPLKDWLQQMGIMPRSNAKDGRG